MIVGQQSLNPIWEPSRQSLTVTDIERLAKAGVTMSFADIANQVVPDEAPVPVEQDYRYPRDLVDSFWQRWRRANPPTEVRYGAEPSFGIPGVAEFGDKVYVFVAPNDAEPFILEDEKHLYPSDALMAKLHLRERTK